MKTLLMLVGLPASGKTTYALELIAKEPHWKRINKDSLRDMLDGGKWTAGNERFVLEARDALITLALHNGRNVICDDTNLDPKHRLRFAELALAEGAALAEKNDFLEVPLEVCIERDLKRANSAGERVIRKMWKRYLAPKITPPAFNSALPDAIIVDIDGTLALKGDRSPFDWARVGEDQVNPMVRNVILDAITSDFADHILLVSGRDSVCRADTEKWLKRNGVIYHQLWMRAEGDNRDDRIIKEEIYRREIEGKYNVELVLDDRNKVVEFWRGLGLTCWQVAEGDF